MPSGHIKVKQGSGHVFYMVTPCHTTESVPNGHMHGSDHAIFKIKTLDYFRFTTDEIGLMSP